MLPKVEVKLDLTPAIQTTYQDAASPLLQEVGKLGADVARTVRLALFPIQLASHYQQRLENYLSEVLHRVQNRKESSQWNHWCYRYLRDCAFRKKALC